MQLTIDSSEPLADVLRVLGTVYDVTLVTDAVAPSASAPATSKRSNGSGKPSRTRKPSARTNGRSADASQIRQWAAEQGMTVSGRGALSKSVYDAYAAAGN